MLRVNWLQPQRPIDGELYSVAVPPGLAYRNECAWLQDYGRALSIHGQPRGRSCPCRYSQVDGKALWFLQLQGEGGLGFVRILRMLHQRRPSSVLLPG